MALVNCPECGHEGVSSLSPSCPNCGFPIANHFQKMLVKEGYSNGFYRARFDNGFSDGASGVLVVEYIWSSGPSRSEDDYCVHGNCVQLRSRQGLYCRDYIYISDYLYNPQLDWKGSLPQTSRFNSTLERFTENCNDPLTITFSEDGTYNEYVQCANGGREYRPGIYLRNGEIIVLKPTDVGLPHILIVCDDIVHCVEYILCEKAKKAKALLHELECQEREKKPSSITPSTSVNAPKLLSGTANNTVRCPYCKSARIKKIGALGRLASVGFWGFASSKIGKQWHCQSCASDF